MERKEPEYRLLDSPQKALEAYIEAIESAKTHIYIEMYAFSDDQSGQAVQKALIQKAGEGCQISILYDAFGSFETKQRFFDEMKKCGISIDVFHPASFLRWKYIRRRNHRKIVVVDGKNLIVGGFNFSNQSLRSSKYYDLAIYMNHIDIDISSTFTHKKSNQTFTSQIANQVSLVKTWGFWSRAKAYHLTNSNLNKAKTSIYITNPYLLPPMNMLRRIQKAARRGVDVHILVSEKSDSPLLDKAMLYLLKTLNHERIHLYHWPGFCHAKSLIIDTENVLIGSYNWDYQSMFLNYEVFLQIENTNLASNIEKSLQSQIRLSKKVSIQDWKRESKTSRFISQLLFRIRVLG